MSCEKYKELISAMIDGEISDNEQSILDDHLKNCFDCRQLTDEMKRLSGFGSSFNTMQMPESLEKNILNKTVKSEYYNQSIFNLFKGYYRIPRGLVWGTLLAILFLIGDTVFKPFKPASPISVVRIENVDSSELVRRIVFTEDDIVSSSTVIKSTKEIPGE